MEKTGNHINNEKRRTLEERIMQALVEEYEHQYGVQCTYQEIGEDKNCVKVRECLRQSLFNKNKKVTAPPR